MCSGTVVRRWLPLAQMDGDALALQKNLDGARRRDLGGAPGMVRTKL
jgi:hypothetical protein